MQFSNVVLVSLSIFGLASASPVPKGGLVGGILDGVAGIVGAATGNNKGGAAAAAGAGAAAGGAAKAGKAAKGN